MEPDKVKWRDKEVYVHHIARNGEFILASELPTSERMFSIPMSELDLKGKPIEHYLIKSE